MRDFIGVVDPFILTKEDELDITPLKQQALMFDRVAIPNLKLIFKNSEKAENGDEIEELRWLSDVGLIFSPEVNKEVNILNPEHDKAVKGSVYHALKMVGILFGIDIDRAAKDLSDRNVELSEEELREILLTIQRGISLRSKEEDLDKVVMSSEFITQVKLMTTNITRMCSIRLREADGLDAYPILSTSILTNQDTPAAKSDVVHIVLARLPIPDDSTSWEQIIEFRNDKDAYNKFIDLRHWMSQVARAQLTPIEIEEKLEHLLSQYQRHMEIHKMKTNVGMLETTVVTGGEFIENLGRLKVGSAAKALYSVKHRKIELLEGELTSPGSEVAYIMKANETFNT